MEVAQGGEKLAVATQEVAQVLLRVAGITAQGTMGDKMITISCNGETHTATLAGNKRCEAFYALLQKGDITLDMLRLRRTSFLHR